MSYSLDDAQGLSPEGLQGFQSWKSSHFSYLGYLQYADKTKESEYSEYAEVRDHHEDAALMSSHECFEVRHPAVFDHQVNHEDAEKTEFNALWNQTRFSNTCEEQSKSKHRHEVNKAIPHGISIAI